MHSVLTDARLIHDETINILLAGRDTTASTLTFAVYRLAEHPSVLQRLRKEVLEVVGPSRRPTYEDIRNMNAQHSLQTVQRTQTSRLRRSSRKTLDFRLDNVRAKLWLAG